jgi:deoxyribodipyrimidine photolyase-related protein
MSLLILPNQLFNLKHISTLDVKHVTLYEHPAFFTKYSFNRLKLVLHRASMKLYQQLLKAHYRVDYVEFHEALPSRRYMMFFQPNNIKLTCDIVHVPSPNFLAYEHMKDYAKKIGFPKKRVLFNSFYETMKKNLGLAIGKSQDKNNRLTIPKSEWKKVPQLDVMSTKPTAADIAYIKKHFPRNPGPDWDEIRPKWVYPLTHSAARAALMQFVNHRLKKFGPYQDYIMFSVENWSILYHSNLSSSLNIGLINPSDCIHVLPSSTPSNISSVEGFIRQLFWREYQLFCYIHVFNSGNFDTRRVPRIPAKWYTGIGILPVDLLIKKAFSCGYLQHIERLMVIGNYMVLSGVDPKQGFQWFMEFSIDSYEWVMYQNVYDMVFNYNKKKTMTRMYISSSQYIVRMSNINSIPGIENAKDNSDNPNTKGKMVKVDKNWRTVWDSLFASYVAKHNPGYPYKK